MLSLGKKAAQKFPFNCGSFLFKPTRFSLSALNCTATSACVIMSNSITEMIPFKDSLLR